MNKIEQIIGAEKYQEIKKFLFGAEKEKEEVKMAQATLEDGTVIEIDGELAEGVAVFVVTEEGNLPAPDATHILSDGTKVTTVNGIVTAIEQAGQEEAPELMAAVEALEQTIQEYQAQITKMKEEQSKFNKDVFEALEAIANGKPESKKDKFGKAQTEEKVNSKLQGLSELLKINLKK